ncbi:methyl-accepting chemotaxis protein [Priestia taiwanensis]|uniref:Methyl-accepting chemotaxis protein n=1 Tax=Priestia taiwanensis TaxID=1347902 RepID=A0A917AR57_9BACI|nr:methyl-accepting chemotaxis protein [Priestia taiwanensis]MBM7363849.1 methyl-accepting chemotaxis protein [Priestia taiwanensis]GGE69486.1 methyl-accepting chemotaxis protein [Priestia taiwanensis]
MKKIQSKITLIFTLLMAVTFTIVQLITYMLVSDQREVTIEKDANQRVQELVTAIEEKFTAKEVEFIRYSKDDVLENALKADATEEEKKKLVHDFKVYADLHPEILSLYVGKGDNSFIDAKEGLINYDSTSREWYKQAMDNSERIIWSTPYEDEETKEIIITGSQKIIDPNTQQVLGVMGMDISLDMLKAYAEKVDVGFDGQIFMLDSSNKAIIYPNKDGQDVSGEAIVQEVNKKVDGVFTHELDGEEARVYHSDSGKLGWKVGIIFSVEKLGAELMGIRDVTKRIVIGAILLTSVIVFMFAKTIARPIQRLNKEVQKVTEGDLTVRIESKAKDEVGQLTRNFSHMVEEMHGMVQTIEHSVTNVQDGSSGVHHLAAETIASSKEIASAMDGVAKNATEQANEVETITEKIDRISGSIADVNVSISSMTHLSNESDSVSQAGVSKLATLRSASDVSNTQLQNAESVMVELVERVRLISDVINTIRSISDQTNLLALNASIEAARAGEHGKGFAVVAQEVRKLAEQSKQATENVAGTIKGIQEETQKAVEAMTQTRQLADEQKQSLTETEEVFLVITSIAEQVRLSITDISTSMNHIGEEQVAFGAILQEFAAGSEETAAASEEVNASTDEQLQHLQQVAETSEQLIEQTNELREVVKRFNI